MPFISIYGPAGRICRTATPCKKTARLRIHSSGDDTHALAAWVKKR